MKIPKYIKLSILSPLFVFSILSAQSVSTIPVGFTTWSIRAGSGTARAFTTLSLPLYQPSRSINGASSGVISSITTNAITVSGANWSPSQLSLETAPHCLRITSGVARGRTFLISTSVKNTNETVTLDLYSTNVTDLSTIGVVVGKDTFEIIECDTLGSLFGPPSPNGIIGADKSSNADNVYLSLNGSWSRYYYNTSLGRWTRITLGTPDATNQPILPDSGILYSRLAATPSKLIIAGTVPHTPRQLTIRKSSVTFIGSSWPVDVNLSDSGIDKITEWKSSADLSVADKIYLSVSGSWRRFYHDGSNWRRITLGTPIANDQPISSGSAMLLEKASASLSGGVLFQDLPYSL